MKIIVRIILSLTAEETVKRLLFYEKKMENKQQKSLQLFLSRPVLVGFFLFVFVPA